MPSKTWQTSWATRRKHGAKLRRDTYFQELADTLNLLARYNQMGRSFSAMGPNWRRFEQASHVLVYRSIRGGVRIQRIIHKRQLIEPGLH